MQQNKILYSNFSHRPRVLIVHVPTLATSVLSLWFQAGSRYSPPGKEGLPHLFEHLFLTRNSIATEKKNYLMYLEQHGVLYNAYTNKDLVNYRMVCLPDHEADMLDKLLHSYETAVLSEEHLTHEQNVVINEEIRNHSSISNYIWRLADKGVWPGHELAHDVYGSPASLRLITLADIDSFRKDFYGTDNLSIVVLTPNTSIARITARLETLKKNSNKTFSPVNCQSVISTLYEERDSKDVHTCVSYRLESLDFKDRILSHFISQYLGGVWSSKLVQKLRLDKGLTYWVNTDVYHSFDTGYLRFYFTTQGKHYSIAINYVDEEIEKLRQNEITLDELELHKRLFVTKSYLKLNNWLDMLNFYGRAAFSDETQAHIYNNVIDIVREIQPSDLTAFVQKNLLETEKSITTIGKSQSMV